MGGRGLGEGNSRDRDLQRGIKHMCKDSIFSQLSIYPRERIKQYYFLSLYKKPYTQETKFVHNKSQGEEI